MKIFSYLTVAACVLLSVAATPASEDAQERGVKKPCGKWYCGGK